MKQPIETNKAKYKKYRNSFKRLRIPTEKNYFETEFANHAQDVKNTWRTIRSLINGHPGSSLIDALMVYGNLIKDPTKIAHHFNGFFTGVGHSLAQKIPLGTKNSSWDKKDP